MSSARQSITRWLGWLTLLCLIWLALSNPQALLAQGPENESNALRHGPAVDSGDPSIPDLNRAEEQLQFVRMAGRPRAPASAARSVRVYVIDFNPTIGGIPLVTYKQWNDPTTLMQVYGDDVQAASWDNIAFEIVQHTVVDGYPVKFGGFSFTNEQYLGCLSNPINPYCLQIIDYRAVLNRRYDTRYASACAALASREVDEIWLWGGPFFGYWEYLLVEPWTLCRNLNTDFAVMGFSYERTDAEMLHNLGHRAEDVLQTKLGLDLWDRFDGQRWRYAERYGCPAQPDDAHPEVDADHAHAGNVHFPPNAYCHYQYTRNFPVLSDADDWLDYPYLADQQTTINSPDWSTSHRGFLLWWFRHFPHAAPDTEGNWWLLLFERVAVPYTYYFPVAGR